MKKVLIASIVALALIVGAGAVYAATQDPTFMGLGIGRMLGGQNLLREVATFTGMSVADVQAARQAGKSFAQILTEKGKDVQVFVGQAVASRKAQLDELVTGKRITADQAALSLKNFQDNIEANLNATTTGPLGSVRNANCTTDGSCPCGNAGPGRGQGRGMGQNAGQGMIPNGQSMGRGGRWQNQSPQAPRPQ
jgi:hypothetical protein